MQRETVQYIVGLVIAAIFVMWGLLEPPGGIPVLGAILIGTFLGGTLLAKLFPSTRFSRLWRGYAMSEPARRRRVPSPSGSGRRSPACRVRRVMRDFPHNITPDFWHQCVAVVVTVVVFAPIFMILPDMFLGPLIAWACALFVAHVCLGWLQGTPSPRRVTGRVNGWVAFLALVLCVMVVKRLIT